MMIYEILNDDGGVINRILADEVFVAANFPGRYRVAPDHPGAPPEQNQPSPASIPMRGWRIALEGAGMSAAYRAAVAANELLLIDWETLGTVRRDGALAALAVTLGKAVAEVDAMFAAAAAIQ